MVPREDLRSTVELIREWFDEWQSWQGRSLLSVLRLLSYMGPLVSLARFSAAFRQFCSAIVWVEGGQVIGVVAGHPIGPDPRYWVLKNIVVNRSCRGRSIARELTRGIIEKAASEGAEKAIIMVRIDNTASLSLGTRFGFSPLTVTTDMRLTAPPATPPAAPPANGLRRQRPSDWRRVYELARATTPSALLSFDPIRENGFRQRFDRRLRRWVQNLLSGQREHRFVAEVDGELAATLRIEAHLWGEHSLELRVDPRWRGQLEEALISRALVVLARYRRQPVNIKVFAAHTEAIEVLSRCGFEEKKTQLILGLDLASIGDQAAHEAVLSPGRPAFPSDRPAEWQGVGARVDSRPVKGLQG